MERPKNPLFFTRRQVRFMPFIKSKKTASYFTITLSLISFSFFGLFAIRPTLITAVSLIKQVSDLEKLNLDYEKKIGNIITAQAEYEKIRDDLPFLAGAVPKNPTFYKVVKQIEEYAKRSGFELTQLQIDGSYISNPPSTGKLEQLGFGIVGRGQYTDIFSFMQHLTNWKRIITLDSLELLPEEGTASGSLKVVLKGKTYYEP